MVSLFTIEKPLRTHQIIGASEEKAEPVSAASSVELNTNNQRRGEHTTTCEDDTHESVDLEDQDEIHMDDGDDNDQHNEPQPIGEASVDVGVELGSGGLGGDSGLYNDSNLLFMHDRDNTAMHGSTTTTSTMHDVHMPDSMYGATNMHGPTVMHDFTPNVNPTSTLHIGQFGGSLGVGTTPANHGSYSMATDFDPFNTNPAFLPTDWTTFNAPEWMSGLLPEGGFLDEYGASLPQLPPFPNLASLSTSIKDQMTQGGPSFPMATGKNTINALPSPCGLPSPCSLQANSPPAAAAANVTHEPMPITKTGPNARSIDSDVGGAVPSHSEQRKSARAPKPSTRNSTANAIGHNPGKENTSVPPAKNTEGITTKSRKRGVDAHSDAVGAKYVRLCTIKSHY